MLFNSYIFLFLFLPVTLLIYLYIRNLSYNLAIGFLVLCSLFFYGYFEPTYLILLISSIVINYKLGNWITSLNKQSNKKILMLLGVSFNIALIAYFKYLGLITSSINYYVDDFPVLQVLLPIGISFFTFQQIAYLIDAYRDEIDRSGFLNYCLFITFFPQLIAGPIVHHREMLPQFKTNRRSAVYEDLSVGFSIFIFGLFKKVVLADNVAVIASKLFNVADGGGSLTLAEAWIATAAYTLQIYFDFSGYSDMAIGLARMFGITLPINFNSPYKSLNISEFWRRWHMTLSRFLRDYVYIALGGNRRSSFRQYINLLATMLVGGIWHGSGWNFLLWGGAHGLLLVLHQLYVKYLKRYIQLHPSLSLMLTLLLVAILWIPFRAETFEGTKIFFSAIFGFNGLDLKTNHIGKLEAAYWIFPLFLIAIFLPNSYQIFARYYSTDKHFHPSEPERFTLFQKAKWHPDNYSAIVIILMLAAVIYQLSDISEFIYFQF